MTPWTAACQASLSFTISRRSLKLLASNRLILSSLSVFAFIFFPASGSFQMHQLFTSGGQVLEFQVISPSNEYSGLTSFRIDWFDLFAVQRTLKSLLQHHSLKAIFQCLAFFTVRHLHLYRTTGKTIALTIWTFVSKVMSLLFNMVSRFVIAFLPRNKGLLASCLQSPSTVILEPRK